MNGERRQLTHFVVYLVVMMMSLATVTVVEDGDRVASGERPSIVDALAPSSTYAAEGRWLTIRPPLGRYSAPLRVYVTRQEFEISRRLEAFAARPSSNPYPTAADVAWHIEESAHLSPTVQRQVRVWNTVQWMTERFAQLRQSWKVDVIVGRTQQFISQQLAEVGCVPDLSAFSGRVLMGATLCNRHVIVINLTGFLFLTKSSQSITAEMEGRAEPAVRSLHYLIVERNNVGLAHEWVHVLRSAIIGSVVREGDPVWFREGYAHVLSLLARTRASRMEIDYVYSHVMSLRYDRRLLSACPGSLADYRQESAMVHGCSYVLGGLALEYLLAFYGGIGRLMSLFRLTNHGVSFAGAFAAVYGMSLAEFEQKADVVISSVRKASRR